MAKTAKQIIMIKKNPRNKTTKKPTKQRKCNKFETKGYM